MSRRQVEAKIVDLASRDEELRRQFSLGTKQALAEELARDVVEYGRRQAACRATGADPDLVPGSRRGVDRLLGCFMKPPRTAQPVASAA